MFLEYLQPRSSEVHYLEKALSKNVRPVHHLKSWSLATKMVFDADFPINFFSKNKACI